MYLLFNKVELRDNKGNKVGGHGNGGLEDVPLPLLALVLHSCQGHIGQAHHVTMCILGTTMALWSKVEIQKYTF